MKYTIITISSLCLWSIASMAAEPAAPANENGKIIYSLGYELGKDIKHQKLELEPELLLQGARDAIEGNKALVSKSMRHKSLKNIKQQRALDNLRKSQAFLAANAAKEGVKSLPSGLQYREVRTGEGKAPQIDGKVTVNYRGSLIDGREFDSSYERGKPATFQVKKVIKGWKEALLLMKEGAKWELFIPPQLAYGKRGRPNSIPPNSALLFEVELLTVR